MDDGFAFIAVVYQEGGTASQDMVGVGVADGEVEHSLQAGPDLDRDDELGFAAFVVAQGGARS